MRIFKYEEEYPRYIGDIKALHPEWSEDSTLPQGWIEVDTSMEIPAPLEGFYPKETLIMRDGIWYREFEQTALESNHQEKLLQEIERLKEEDYTKYRAFYNWHYIQNLPIPNNEANTNGEVDNGGDNI